MCLLVVCIFYFVSCFFMSFDPFDLGVDILLLIHYRPDARNSCKGFDPATTETCLSPHSPGFIWKIVQKVVRLAVWYN